MDLQGIIYEAIFRLNEIPIISFIYKQQNLKKKRLNSRLASARVLVSKLAMSAHIIVVLETIVIISWEKHVGMQRVVWLVRHVHHPNGNARYDHYSP